MFGRKVGVVAIAAALFVVGTIGVVGANSGFGLLGGSGTDSMYLNGDASYSTTTAVTIDSSVENATEMRLIPPVRYIESNPNGSWAAAIATDGTLWAWGLSNEGQCGVAGAGVQGNPNRVSAESDWATVTAGVSAGYALKSDGTLWSWGGNGSGQLGTGDTATRITPVQIGAGNIWRSVAAGDRHVLAIRNDGTLWAWGNNGFRQVTGSSGVNVTSPVQVLVGSTFKAIAAGGDSSYAIRADGVLYSWGRNDEGQAGTGGTGGGYLSQLSGTGWQSVSAGGRQASAIDAAGAVWVWGANYSGATGQGTTTPSLQLTPIKVPGLVGVRSVRWANGGALAHLPDGSAVVWGGNATGQLGLGDKTSRYSPTVMPGGHTFDQIAGGFSTVYFRKGSSFLVSGGSSYYGVGDPEMPEQTVPTTVGVGWEPYQATRAARLSSSVGTQAVCVTYRSAAGSETVLSDTIIVDTYAPTGSLAINAGESRVRDTDAVLFNSVTGASSMRIAGGSWRPYSVDATHALSPGDGEKAVTVEFSDEASNTMSVTDTITVDTLPPSGTLSLNAGASTTRNRRVSVAIAGDDAVAMRAPGMGAWQSVSMGSASLMGIKPDGTLWGTGINATGNIGDGTWFNRSYFVPVMNMPASPLLGVAAGGAHTLAVCPDRTLWAWGSNYSGQLGLGTTGNSQAAPVAVDLSTTWAKAYAQGDTSFGIKMDGSLWAWGSNAFGQLGIGNTTSPQPAPLRVGGAAAYFSSVAPGNFHTLGIKTDGSLWAWGSNSSGQLGDGTTTQALTPVRVGTATDWRSVSAGGAVSAAIKSDGTLWIWGSGSSGALGNGTLTNSLIPQQVGTGTDWATVDVGGVSVLARKTGGTLWAWGGNSGGQLGDRTKADRLSPRQVGTRSDWIDATTNGSEMAAITTDGSLWCWGSNTCGSVMGRTPPHTIR